MNVLDTNTLSDLWKGHPRIQARLEQATEPAVITIITRIETLEHSTRREWQVAGLLLNKRHPQRSCCATVVIEIKCLYTINGPQEEN